MNQTPFTVSADMDLGTRIKPYLVSANADVTIYEGDVPEQLAGNPSGGIAYQVTETEFLLKMPSGTRYLVREGREIIYQRGDGDTDRDIALFLLGSAWGALCYQRELLPLHASAITVDNQIYAFTGHSGAGKSTLSAALADRGREFFTDDVLIIDPAKIASEAACYTGQKDLKLWSDALQLTDAGKQARVRDIEGFEKFFATPNTTSSRVAGELRCLFVLSQKAEGTEPLVPAMSPLKGGQAMIELATSVYRPGFANHIWGRRKLYKALDTVIRHVAVHKFRRPFVKDDFAEGVDFLNAWIDADIANMSAAEKTAG